MGRQSHDQTDGESMEVSLDRGAANHCYVHPTGPESVEAPSQTAVGAEC